MKVVCIKNIKNFIVNQTYKSELHSGLIYVPYIPVEELSITFTTFKPSKAIKSRYSTTKINSKNYSEIKKYDRIKSMYKVHNENSFEIFEEDTFKNYFISLKEYRKMKLEKINDNN